MLIREQFRRPECKALRQYKILHLLYDNYKRLQCPQYSLVQKAATASSGNFNV